VLEEAVELLEISVGDRQERLGDRLGRSRAVWFLAADVGDLHDQLVAEAFDPADHPDDVAALEQAGELVGVAEGAGLDAAAAITQLERQVRAAGARLAPILAHTRVDASYLVPGTQRADRRFFAHSAMMYGESDAAPEMELPARPTARTGARLRLPGLERRRRRRFLGSQLRRRVVGCP
jgi:hypothetical protein